MSLNNIKISEKLVPENYLKLALAAQKSKETAIRELLEKRKLPEYGWPDEQIEELVKYLATLDSNNFRHNSGLGEREARIACNLVKRRHYNFGHGIGRSGDLLEPQPKAAGSTLLANLTNSLLLELIRLMGIRSCRSCFLVPLATGMTLALCLLAMKKLRPKAKYVLWSRIDQKSCFKSITTSGLIPIIIDTELVENSTDNRTLKTNISAFEKHINDLGCEQILCLYTTTSCFAPRNCDDIVEIAKLAAKYDLPHLVNNAYGLQSTQLTHQLEQAQRVGRLDIFVQSTDKNLMVPVGGAIVAGFDDVILRTVAKTYAGRASSSQTLDVFMTLLSLGKQGYQQLVKARKGNFKYLTSKLESFSQSHNAKVLKCERNPISLALTLDHLISTDETESQHKKKITQLGAMLYTRGVSGVRVVTATENKDIDGYSFNNWGAHSSQFQVPYLTVAAAIGVTSDEIDIFIQKLKECWDSFLSK